MATGGEIPRRANPLEVIGAWLRIWTPPRDVDIPPVPWRKLAIGTGIGVVVLAAALVVMVPRIDSGKQSRAEQSAAFKERAIATNHARIVREQRAMHGSAAALKPSRTELLHRVEASIMADARSRAAAGEMRHVDGPTTCSVTPGTKVGAVGVYDCFTITQGIKQSSRTSAGTIGYPFRAVVNFGTFTYAWCKVEQFPGEKLIPDPRLVVQLPAACRAPSA